jgi:hypothetical protein
MDRNCLADIDQTQQLVREPLDKISGKKEGQIHEEREGGRRARQLTDFRPAIQRFVWWWRGPRSEGGGNLGGRTTGAALQQRLTVEQARIVTNVITLLDKPGFGLPRRHRWQLPFGGRRCTGVQRLCLGMPGGSSSAGVKRPTSSLAASLTKTADYITWFFLWNITSNLASNGTSAS